MNNTSSSSSFSRAQARRDVQVARDLHDAVWRSTPSHAAVDAALARFTEIARERWQDRLARAEAAGHTRAAERARRELYLLGM